jgi:ribonuclease P protein component
MIKKLHRFHGYGSLRYVYKNGQTVRGPLCALKFTVNKKRSNYRLAVVVNKKVSKSAVTRNRIRRRLYEAFRSCENKMAEPYDMVVTVFSDQIAEMSFDDLSLLVNAQLKQAGITKSTS